MSRAEKIEPMSVVAFVDWATAQPGDERYELYDGVPFAMAAERVVHARTKANVWLALRDAITSAGAPCEAFIDGPSLRIDQRNTRIPDVIVQCADADPESAFLEMPMIVVEIVSPSSEARDMEAKLVDYFLLPSLRHYLIVLPSRRTVVHHRRVDDSEEIATRILGDGAVDLSPPGFSVAVAAFFDERP